MTWNHDKEQDSCCLSGGGSRCLFHSVMSDDSVRLPRYYNDGYNKPLTVKVHSTYLGSAVAIVDRKESERIRSRRYNQKRQHNV